MTLAAWVQSDSILTEQREQKLFMVLATESGIDQSRAAVVFVHGLLIQPFARVVSDENGRQLPFIMPNRMCGKFSRVQSFGCAGDIAKYGIVQENQWVPGV